MSSSIPRWAGWIAVTVSLALAMAWLTGRVADRRAFAGLAAQARTDARLRASLLDSEIARFRLLPFALAGDREVLAAIGGDVAARREVNVRLAALARVTGAPVIYVIGPDGRAIAASNWQDARSFVGADYRFRRYFRAARATGEGRQFALGTVSGRPGLYLARRTANGGVIVIKLEFDRIEREWARAGGVSLVRDSHGMVLVTSRADWRFMATRALRPAEAAQVRGEASLPARMPVRMTLGEDGEIDVERARYAAATVATALPGWRLTLLLPAAAIGPVRHAAALGALLAVIALSALLFALRQRADDARRRTAELEAAVAERTAALRREMDERAASEAQAADLREALRQANRLAALGQITASVAHETAQPVAAIRTYAETSALLLDRGHHDEVRGNLTAITRLTERIGTVTAELRGFARRRPGEVRAVALAEVIEGARLILKERLRGVELILPAIDPALCVMGGRVRLEQVVVNLIQNALDALEERDDPRITIALADDGTRVTLTIADNGPGIAPDVAERLFLPFVTSRPSGLGLGLVIAQDIMAELGGALRLVPGTGGAAFEIGMRRA